MRETVLHVIFLDLRKAHNALDRNRCPDILVGYEVGPRMICILRTYWVRLHMVANVGGHYGTVFQRYYRVTQGGPLSPMIFNVALEAVI